MFRQGRMGGRGNVGAHLPAVVKKVPVDVFVAEAVLRAANVLLDQPPRQAAVAVVPGQVEVTVVVVAVVYCKATPARQRVPISEQELRTDGSKKALPLPHQM